MNTIERFKSGRINKAGTAFTTAATVATQQHTGGPFYTSLSDVVEALGQQGVTGLNIWKALYVYRSIGALEDEGEGFLKWAYDPRPFAAKVV